MLLAFYTCIACMPLMFISELILIGCKSKSVANKHQKSFSTFYVANTINI